MKRSLLLALGLIALSTAAQAQVYEDAAKYNAPPRLGSARDVLKEPIKIPGSVWDQPKVGPGKSLADLKCERLQALYPNMH